MKKKTIYLDYNATSPLRPEVLHAMEPYLHDTFGNPSSMHATGQKARKALDDARETVARLLHAARPDEIIFTAGGTESDNMAIKGTALANKAKGKHIITSQIEHHAVLYTCEYLEKEGFEVTYLPVDNYGRVNPEDVRRSIRPDTILVTIMHANNEVGTIEPIAEIGKVIKEENTKRASAGLPKVYFHTDAVQTAGKIEVDVQELGVDMLSISAHKFYGPKGIGALYIKRVTAIQPILHGGHHERNRRAGTENVPAIVGMAYALELALKEHSAENARLAKLRDKFEAGVKEKVPAVIFNGHPVERLPNTLSISFTCIEGESLLLALDLEGIEVSTGSACASGSLEPSHVLKAMGISAEVAQGTLRFSLGHYTTEEDIDRVLEVLPRLVARLREMSPLWKAAR